MVIHLYGSPFSTCTKRVAVVLHEKQIPFEMHPVDMAAGEHKSPAFLKNQPFGVVPYIVDDGFVLYESRAIGRYLALKYASQGTPGLIPSQNDIQKTALFEQMASVELTTFDPYAAGAGYEKFVKAHLGLQPDEAAYAKALASLDAKLAVYDEILGKTRYLAGDEVTLADLYHLAWGAMLKAGGSDIMTSRPNVARWWTDITSRPSWTAIQPAISSVGKYD